MSELIIIGLCTVGALFILLAAIGFVRMPDFFLRVSVTTKATTLGVGLILGGAILYFSEASVVSRGLAIILFLLLTAPVAAHMIGRTAYFIGTRLWEHSVVDDLEGKYKKDTHELASREQAEKDADEDECVVKLDS